MTHDTLTADTAEKLKRLENILREMERVVVCYSGGVDSAYLLVQAHATLGADNVLGVIGVSGSLPPGELDSALAVAKEFGVRVEVVETNEIDNPDYVKNDGDRCYHCKAELFDVVGALSRSQYEGVVLDGFNWDDQGDHRPGHQAGLDREVRSPLLEAELTKDDIRTLSRRLDLPTWNKPALACLASRMPYGEHVTIEKLDQVGQAERFLLNRGIKIVRVRHHGDVARIEVAPDERHKFFDMDFMDEVTAGFRALGFRFVALDLQGYRSGSMNETLAGT